jgi:hypothetical protein
MAIARAQPMWALNSAPGSSSTTIDLGFARPFVAFATITMVDSLIDYDRDNAVVADIFTVDGVRTPSRVNGGDHFGDPDTGSNVFPGAFVGFGRRIQFFLRAFHIEDLEAYGEAVVITLD